MCELQAAEDDLKVLFFSSDLKNEFKIESQRLMHFDLKKNGALCRWQNE